MNKIPNLRNLPPCMGGIKEDKSICQDPIPGSARFEEIKRRRSLAREEEEKRNKEKRIEKLEEQTKKNDKQMKNLKHQQITGIDIRRICDYEEIGEYVEGLALVRDKSKKYGYIDTNYKEVIECKYDEANAFKDGKALVKEKGYYGYINNHGKEIIPCKYDEISLDFRCGFAIVKRDGYYGFIDKNYKEVIECKYDEVSYFRGSHFSNYINACVKKNNKIYIINNNGEIIDFELHENDKTDKYLYDYNDSNDEQLSEFFEELQVVKHQGRYGYKDQNDNWVTKRIYDEAFPFSNHRAVVKKDGKYFYLSVYEHIIRGKVVSESKYCYEAASNFVEDIACVKISGKLFFIDKDYNIIGWDFPKKNKNIENCTNEVMYNPSFVINNEFGTKLTFFRENDKITFLNFKGDHINNHNSDYGFKIVNDINTDALKYPWLFCNGIPYYKKNKYIFVINVDFEHENEHDGLELIRYFRKLFGCEYFQMFLANNELKKMIFDKLKIESENVQIKEKIYFFIERAKEYLVKNGEWENFLETFNKNKHFLNNINELTCENSVGDIQIENESQQNEFVKQYVKRKTLKR